MNENVINKIPLSVYRIHRPEWSTKDNVRYRQKIIRICNKHYVDNANENLQDIVQNEIMDKAGTIHKIIAENVRMDIVHRLKHESHSVQHVVIKNIYILIVVIRAVESNPLYTCVGK